MNEIKLKPCPFCGGEAEIWEVTTGEKPLNEETNVSVACLQCFSRPFFTRMENLRYRRDHKEILEDMKHEVAEKWNRRAENKMSVQSASWEFKYDEDYDDELPCCSICGEPDALSRDDYSYRGGKIRDNNSNYCPNCGAKMDGDNEK